MIQGIIKKWSSSLVNVKEQIIISQICFRFDTCISVSLSRLNKELLKIELSHCSCETFCVCICTVCVFTSQDMVYTITCSPSCRCFLLEINWAAHPLGPFSLSESDSASSSGSGNGSEESGSGSESEESEEGSESEEEEEEEDEEEKDKKKKKKEIKKPVQESER